MDGALSSFTGISAMQRLSIFADDVIVFFKSTVQDMNFVKFMLDAFGVALVLKVDYRKSKEILIRGTDEDSQHVANLLQCELGNFTCKYLGLPLAINQLDRGDWRLEIFMPISLTLSLPFQKKALIHKSIS